MSRITKLPRRCVGQIADRWARRRARARAINDRCAALDVELDLLYKPRGADRF